VLRDLGARVISFPTIQIQPPEDPSPLLDAVRRSGSYDWIVFTSVNGVAAVDWALGALGRRSSELGKARVAAIGPATAAAVRETLGLEVSVLPSEYRAESLAASLLEAEADPGRAHIFLPRAAEAREVLPRLLEEAGAEVDEVPAYRTILVDGARAGGLRASLAAGEVDWLTFTASSTVRGFVEAVGTDVGRSRVAAVGPITAGTARELGLPVHAVASEFTIEGLVEALVEAETAAPAGGRHG
jgi:uroporphyrinogen-III synthase